MTELGERERFRGLDRLPVPDLRSDIRERTPSRPPPGPPWRRLGAAAVAFAVAAAGLALVGRAFFWESGDGRLRAGSSLAAPDERAGTVAIAALTEAGLHDYAGTFYDYGGIRRAEDGWIASFCAPPGHCDADTPDAFLTIVPEGDDLVVTEVAGVFTEAQRTGLLGYREPADPPPARWIYRPIVAGTSDETNAPALRASSYWTGAIPSNLGSLCRFEALDAQGEIAFATRETALHPPESERGRDGWALVELPRGVQVSGGRMVCGAWLPLQAVPEGPRHVLASGTLETGEHRGEDWRLVVWRGENVDDPSVLELWRLNAEGEDVYCWGFDAPGQVSWRFGQRIPPGGCSAVSELPDEEPIGAIAKGPVAGEGSHLAMGEVSLDVASLEFRLTDGTVVVADLLDPPADLGVPRRFFIQSLAPGSTGEMVALDADGEVLATERIGGKSA